MNSESENKNYKFLKKINSPKDLQKISDLKELCNEIRRKLIEVVSKNGGHLSANLGVVELTVALYKSFCEENDRIIWDVSHQSYVHKMLTGRFDKIDTIRQEGGLSGFTNRQESEYDVFTEGHSSTSISAALGLARARQISGEKGSVIAVIGDGALTSGIAYEGLNNAGRLNKNFVLVLNDNKMSISKNVGAVARYLASVRIRPSYMKAKNTMERFLDRTRAGLKIKDMMKSSKSAFKRIIYNNNMFEQMGLSYYGPVDGHNLQELQKAFDIVKSLNKPTVVHVITQKGKGYKFAEKRPDAYHCISAFDIVTGEKISSNTKKTFSQEFGESICKLAEGNPKICAITAAMSEGTCLKKFKNNFKQRFFDVGIAEEHAVTFAGGLSAGGMIPVFAVYSTFLQRAYDQIIHDVSLQDLKLILAVDRAGLTGQDGETHQGVFDVPFLNTIPNVKIYSPSFLCEIEPMLKQCINDENGISVIRYPRGGELSKPTEFSYSGNDFDFYGNLNSQTLLVTYGRIFSNLMRANNRLEKIDKTCCVLKLNVIKPIPQQAVKKSLKFKNIIFFEESVETGSASEKFGAELLKNQFSGKYLTQALEDKFVKHATAESQLKKAGLDTENMLRKILFNLE